MGGIKTANPGLAQFRFGFEDTDCGLGDVSTFQDFRARSEAVGAELPQIEDDSIGAFGEQLEGEESKILPDGPFNLNWGPEDHAKFFAGYFGKSATPVESPTGVWTHKLAVTESDVSFGSGAVEISRDRQRPTFYTGAEIAGISFATGPRAFLNGAVTLIMPRFIYHDDATQVTGTSTFPILRGLYGFSDLELATPDLADLFVTVDAVPGSADFEIKAKIGLASTYDGAAIPVTVGNDADGNPIFTVMKHTVNDIHVGQSDELPIELHWTDLTGIAALDEFRIPAVRDVWTSVLPVRALFNEIATFITFQGQTERVREFNLDASRAGLAPDEAIGFRFVDVIDELGDRTATGNLNRRALQDLGWENHLVSGEPFTLEVLAKSTLIGATGVRRELKLTAKNCRASGRTASIAGAAQFDEPFPFACHPSTDGTYPAALTAELKNSQASLA